MAIDVNEWLQPIPGDSPTGEDVSFSDTYDRIRDARRADDPNLSQGDWERELKVANWRQVIDLAGGVLERESKDLQAAVWLGEALISQHHLPGATAAFELLTRLQQDFWEGLYPEMEGDDVEERAAKLAWFNTYGSQALLKLKVSPGAEGFTLADWQVSRDVDNLSRQDASAYQEALGAGRPTGEIFDKAVYDTDDATLLAHAEAANQALEAFRGFKAVTDEKMGRDGPSLNVLEDTLKRMQQVFSKAAGAKGLLAAADAGAADEGGDTAYEGAPAGGGGGGTTLNFGPGDAANKAAALRAVGEIAAWFRRVEPHSPVPFLLDRAVAWADTPLDEWLAEVVQDDHTLSNIRQRIGLSE